MPQCQLHHLSFTLPAATTAATLPQLMASLLDIQNLDPTAVRLPRGRHGYREAYSLTGEHGAELVTILLSGVARNVQRTVNITVHGAALETGAIDVQHLCREIIDRGGWGTNGHLAADDTDGVLPWREIVDCSAADQWVSRVTTTTNRPRRNKKNGEMEQNPPVYMRSYGETVYYGQQDSDLSICLYTRRGPVRVETRIRSRAGVTDVIRRIADGEDIGAITAGILRRNLRFHEPGGRRKDRRPVCGWWLAFLGGVEAIKLPRHRSARHRNPWYSPPTKADMLRKALDNLLQDDSPELIDQLRGRVLQHDQNRIISRAWNPAL